MTGRYVSESEHDEAFLDTAGEDHPHRRGQPRGRTVLGCLLPLLILVGFFAALYFGLSRGIEALQDRFSQPEDFAGPGSADVTFQVKEGATAADMGRSLKDEGVVASTEAFIEAANANPESTGIQPGFYPLKKEMRAADVVEVLVNPDNIITTTVAIPEGLRMVDIVAQLAKQTDFTKARIARALEKPRALGLPQYAGGNPEGYLFPATYAFGPDATPESMLKAMVDRWRQAAKDADLESAAARLGYTPHELMTVASLVQSEGKTPEDMAKISRVIYNRLEGPGDKQGTNGLLQIDATVDYALDRPLTVGLTQEERQNTDSPYNTYRYPGLVPGPISSPGDAAINAAAHPAEGDWYYYVTVDLATGETKFAETYDEFLTHWNELRDYCANESQGAC